jgi:hypothetical protein
MTCISTSTTALTRSPYHPGRFTFTRSIGKPHPTKAGLINGEKLPSINGTGSEDYFLGAWGFGNQAFAYALFGAPVKGEGVAGSRSSLYRFHLDSLIPFTKSLRATIEHGHANHRSDNFFSVAYWYQTEPHGAFPTLPPVELRVPKLHPVGGPGNAGK